MPARRRLVLDDQLRETMEETLRLSMESYQRALEEELAFKMRLSLASQAGLRIDDISTILGVSSSTVGRWKAEGDRARQERYDADIRSANPRETVEEAVRLSRESQRRALDEIETFKMKVSLAKQSGLTIDELSALLADGQHPGASSSTVGRWKTEGDKARKRRRSTGPDGPREQSTDS
ncbi:hypothetical protein ACZ90_00475 [Streptomyces albus subsp. albus]|nr:hypothetical protein ACZ90_00475 [Streptomyces albus subsp. albus]